MTIPERIDKLLALLSTAFTWCYITGEWSAARDPIAVKKHGRKSVSTFHRGLDKLREVLLNLSERSREFNYYIEKILKPLIIQWVPES